MVRFAMVLAAVLFSTVAEAQISCANAALRDTTDYPNGLPADSLFFTCAGEIAQLIATPPGGVPGWTFEWFIYSVFQNAWIPSTVETNVSVSTKNINSGGARVRITDGNGIVVGTDIVWVCRINSAPIINANTIPAGCGSITLSALYINGVVTPYYIPPPTPLEDTVLFSSNTQVQLCLDVDHSFLSDLGFYLQGPASCGAPRVQLFPSLISQGLDPYCNLIDGAVNVCFDNTSSASLDYCAVPNSPLTGSYSGYGNPSQTIDWSPLIGCDMSESDWSVVMVDCEAGNAGWLTSAQLTFSGVQDNQEAFVQQFALPLGPPPAIEDGECNPDSANVAHLVIEHGSAQSISNTFGYQWVANPPFPLPNDGQQLTIVLNPGPTEDTEFTFRLTGVDVDGACGILSSDTEFFDYLTPGAVEASTPQLSFCEDDAAVQLDVNLPYGAWMGEGITDTALGLFDPALVASDTAQIIFATTNVCITPDTLFLPVDHYDAMSLIVVEPICADQDPIQMQASTPGGIWYGAGIVDSLAGLFDPGLAQPGSHPVTYVLPGACLETSSLEVDVIDPNSLSISAQPSQVCQDAAAVTLQTNQPGGIWIGAGVDANNTFHPTQVQPGTHIVYYQLDGVCSLLDSLTILVLDTALSISPVAPRCIDQGNFYLSASQPGGYWTGQGITNQVTGLFNPMSIGAAGTYTVQYQIPGVCPLSEQASVIIEDYPEISFNFDSIFCGVDEVIALSATPPGGSWGGDANAEGFLNPLGQAGNFQISYTTNGACVAFSNTSIQVAEPPVVMINAPLQVCPNAAFTLVATGAVSYNWSPSANLNAVFGDEVVGELTEATLFEVVGMNDSGCMDTAQWSVEPWEIDSPLLAGDSVVCDGASAMLQVDGILNGWQWQLVDSYDAMNDAIFFTPTMDQVVTVQGLDIHDCLVSDEIQVLVLSPQANLSPLYQDVALPEHAVFENLGQGSAFIWTMGNGDSLFTSVPEPLSYAYSTQDTFVVVLTAVQGACVDTAQALVYAHFVSSIQTIPNIITMNADGLNDSFRIESDYLRALDIQFYDRWGHPMGSITEVNGIWTPPTLISQVVYYTLRATGLDEVEYASEGTIQIMLGNAPEE